MKNSTMTQEQKNLLLKDLCARLPYGVILNCCDSIREKLTAIIEDGIINHDYYVDEVKPYLFPLSSITDEQLFEAQSILGKNEIKIEDGFLRIVDSDRNTISYLEILALLEWFYKNHFDINGLIPKGLAIDATNLNIY